MTSPPRAVFDTNVFLRIILSTKPEGVAPALWHCLEAGRFQLVISELLLAELRNTLLVPELAEIHGWSEDMVSEYVGSVREIATTVAGTVDVDVPDLAERDPSDLALMSAAVEGTADVIVTQDLDLLDLAGSEGIGSIRVLDPLAFLQELRALERDPEEDLSPVSSP